MQKKSLEEMLSVELKSMKKEHTKQIENLTQELATEKSITQAKLEREVKTLILYKGNFLLLLELFIYSKTFSIFK